MGEMKMIKKDGTYKQIVQYLLDNEFLSGFADRADRKKFVEKWIEARGSIIEAFIEMIGCLHEQDYFSKSEKDLIDTYRCLTPNGKKDVIQFMKSIYSNEVKKRSKKVS